MSVREDYNILDDREVSNPLVRGVRHRTHEIRKYMLSWLPDRTGLAAALVSSTTSGAGHCAGRQFRDVCCDLAWLGEPDLVAVAQNVLHGTP